MTKVRPDFENRDNVPLTRLHLDPENPRHDPINDEDKIIAQLFGAERGLAMSKDIAAKAGISPLDRIGVIEMTDNPGHYIVVEGNRRTCALKVLHDPMKAPNTKAQASIRALAPEAKLPSTFSVVVFRDRETARPWLSLRHLGEQDGAGTRPWDPSQKARFSRGASPDRLALAVLDRAAAAGWIDSATRKTISLTTLTRYLSNPVVRAALGLGSPSELIFTHDPSQVDWALKHLVADATPRKDGSEAPVNSRSKAPERRAYGQALHARGISPRTVLPAPILPPAPLKQSNLKRSRNPRNPDDRPYVVPPDFVVTNRDKSLQRLLSELRSLKPDDGYIFSVNYLVRAVVERIMVLYAKKHSIHTASQNDRQLTVACHDHLLISGVTKNELKNMRVAMSNDDALHSLNTLGAAVHGAHLPSRRSLITVWDNWEPALKFMLTRL